MDISTIQEIEKKLSMQDYSSALQKALLALKETPSSIVFFILMLRAFKKYKLINDLSNAYIPIKTATESFIQQRAAIGLDNFTAWPFISKAHQEIMSLEKMQGKYNKLIDFLEERPLQERVKPKIIVLTCVWQRHELTRIFFSYYKSLKRLLVNKVDIQILAVGSEGEISREICEQGEALYIEHPNEPLTAKWQAGISALKDYDFDALVIMGSDDFVSANVFEVYIEKIKANTLFFGFQDLYIYDTSKKSLIYWYGYGASSEKKSQSHRIGESIGLGRMLHRDLLDYLDFDLWENISANKSLDSIMKGKVFGKTGFLPVLEKNALVFETKDKAFTFGMVLSSFKENSAIGVDVKHSFNVTRIDSYLSSPNTHTIVNQNECVGSEIYTLFDDLYKLSEAQ